MNLVDEQHVARPELGENRRHVSGALDGWTRGHMDVRVHLAGDDIGQGRFAQARRAVEEDVVQGLAAVLGGGYGNRQIVLDLLLANVVGEPPWTQTALGGDVLFADVA